MLSLNDLRLIRQIANTGTLTAAAESLHVSQSAVSQRLAALQARLDTRLVERSNGVMQLTGAGQRLLSAARVVGAEIEAALGDIDALRHLREREIRIATQCYTCYRWLPFVMQGMRLQYPDLTIDVVPEATADPYDALRHEKIDLAIVSNPAGQEGFASTDLFADELLAVVHESHPIADKAFVTPRQLAAQTLLLYTGRKHAVVEEVLKPAKVAPGKIIQVRITEAIIELARAGQGVAVIAGWALDDMINTDDLVAVRISRRGFIRQWRAVTVGPDTAATMHSLLAQLRKVGETLNQVNWRNTLRQVSSP